jgi:glycosyltransferase involved in cell wall biosynthesis
VKLAFVVQRYGTEILGGSEYHCRLAVSETRDINSFNQYSEWIFNHPHTRDDEMEWLRKQGPWSPSLLDYITRHQQAYEALIFFTYLYAPTVLGLQIAPRRSILVPTANDEPAIHLSLYNDVFTFPAAIAYNTEVERRFLTTHFSIRALAEETIGCGVDLLHGRHEPSAREDSNDAGPLDELDIADAKDDDQPLPPHIAGRGAVFRRRHRLYGSFALYGGRIDPGKGCEELIEYFSSYVHDGGDASLILMGVKLMQLPEERWIRFAGLLSERERLQALEAATVVVVPSPYESLSLLALEAFAVGARECQERSARRSLPAQQRRSFLRRSRRVRRGAEADAGRSTPPRRDGEKREGIRSQELPLGRDSQQVRQVALEDSQVSDGAGLKPAATGGVTIVVEASR